MCICVCVYVYVYVCIYVYVYTVLSRFPHADPALCCVNLRCYRALLRSATSMQDYLEGVSSSTEDKALQSTRGIVEAIARTTCYQNTTVSG